MWVSTITSGNYYYYYINVKYIKDIRTIFLELDKDANNEISYKEFIIIMRGEVSQNKKSLIQTIFNTIDKDADGIISMTDIGLCFNPKNHPDVKNGKISVNNFTNNFFETFGSVCETGYIRFQQFLEFYVNLTAFDDEIKFHEIMKSIWLSNDNNTAIPTITANRNYGLSSMSNLLSNTNYNLDYSTSSNSRPNSSTSLNFGKSTVENLMNITSEADSAVLRNLTNLKEQLYKRGNEVYLLLLNHKCMS
jgi:Ca2+-binding EF-hand superfamily protein